MSPAFTCGTGSLCAASDAGLVFLLGRFGVVCSSGAGLSGAVVSCSVVGADVSVAPSTEAAGVFAFVAVFLVDRLFGAALLSVCGAEV